MRINFNPQSNCGNNQHFGIRLVENDSLIRYIDSLHFRNQKNNLKQAVTIIRNQIERNPDNKNLIIGALHPSKANYVKNGTYDEFFITPQKRVKQTSDRFERENIYMQFDGTSHSSNKVK